MIFKPNNHELIQIQDRERREKYGGGSERRKMDRNKEGKSEKRKMGENRKRDKQNF